MSLQVRETFIDRLRIRLNDACIPIETTKIMELVDSCLYGFDLILSEEGQAYVGKDFLPMYIDALRIQGRSSATLERYEYVIKHLMNFVGRDAGEVTIHHVRGYLASEKERGIADITLEGYREIFNAYFGWLLREGLISKNPISNIGAIKIQQKLKTAYSDTDIELLKQNARNNRDIAIVTFLLATACRISEVINLNRSDVDLANMECTVLGKGNKERKVYLDEVAVLFLEIYLNERDDDNEALFVTLKAPHNRLHPGGIRMMLKNLGEISEIDHVHPHKFRRTKATNLLKHGMPIHEVATILGHNKLDTTMEYIVMNDKDVKHSYHKYA